MDLTAVDAFINMMKSRQANNQEKVKNKTKKNNEITSRKGIERKWR